MAAWILPLGSALRRVMLPSRVSMSAPSGSAATSASGTYSVEPGSLTVTVPVRTATLTLSPRTGGGTLAADVGVGAVGAAGGAGASGGGGAAAGMAVVKGTSPPAAKPWWLKAMSRTW